jgi:hypothetical protein
MLQPCSRVSYTVLPIKEESQEFSFSNDEIWDNRTHRKAVFSVYLSEVRHERLVESPLEYPILRWQNFEVMMKIFL